MLKPYAEMRKIDVLPHCEMREAKDDKGRKIEVPYLNWAKCKELLHQNGAEVVYFEPCTNEKGSSLFMSDAEFVDKNGITNRCYEVRVKIVIDDLEFEAQFPLMNGSNPVKDNSLTQQRVWNAQTRAFVKGVAMRTGLGFGLWLTDDTGIEQEPEDDLTKHHLKAIKERMEQEVTSLMKKGLTLADIAKAVGLDEEVFRSKFSYFAELSKIEKKMLELLKNDSK
jgi:hypothetical protein